MANTNKKKDNSLNQSKMNIFKEKKGRLYYYDVNKDQAYYVDRKEQGLIVLYDAKTVISLFVIVAFSSLLSFPFLYTAIVGALIYIGIEVFFRLRLKSFTRTKKMKDEDYEMINSIIVVKEKRKDELFKFSMAFMVALLVILNSFTESATKQANPTVTLLVAGTFSLTLVILHVREYIRYNKQYKELRKDNK